MKKCYLILFLGVLLSQIKAQSIYMSGPGLIGETTTGIHANEVPLEAFEFNNSNGSGASFSDYNVVIRKKINKSSLELMKRTVGVISYKGEYTFKFYDEQDNHYYTISFIDLVSNQDIPSKIISPECSQGNCPKHYEEIYFGVYLCNTCESSITFTDEITGESYTYEE